MTRLNENYRKKLIGAYDAKLRNTRVAETQIYNFQIENILLLITYL